MAKGDASTTKRTFDRLFTYDALLRLRKQEEGQLTGSGFNSGDKSREQSMARLLSGRIDVDLVDLDANGLYTAAPRSSEGGEMDDDRTYNKRNELTSRGVIDNAYGTRTTVNLTYNKNGQMLSDGETYDFSYNPWGQMIEVRKLGLATVLGKYTYNALGQRQSEQTDTNRSANDGVADGAVDSNDPVFYVATDTSGRRVATYRGTDTNPKERFVHHAAVAGRGMSGGPLLRTRATSEQTPTNWATQAGSATHGEEIYYTSDFRGNVVALLSAAGAIVEQYRYSPTGVPMGLPAGDVNGDGKVAGKSAEADYLACESLDASMSAYQVRADLNLSGRVDSDDLAIVSGEDTVETGRKVMSKAAIASHTTSDTQHQDRFVVKLIFDNEAIYHVMLQQPVAPRPPRPPRDQRIRPATFPQRDPYSYPVRRTYPTQPAQPTPPASPFTPKPAYEYPQYYGPSGLPLSVPVPELVPVRNPYYIPGDNDPYILVPEDILKPNPDTHSLPAIAPPSMPLPENPFANPLPDTDPNSPRVNGTRCTQAQLNMLSSIQRRECGSKACHDRLHGFPMNAFNPCLAIQENIKKGLKCAAIRQYIMTTCFPNPDGPAGDRIHEYMREIELSHVRSCCKLLDGSARNDPCRASMHASLNVSPPSAAWAELCDQSNPSRFVPSITP